VKEPFLEVSFRHGRALAAYYYLPRRPGDKSHRTAMAAPGRLIDIDRRGKPIGIEITAPSKVTLAAVNRILRGVGISPAKRGDLGPLRAA
jgi:uncharacterized protein YuzE